MEITQVFSEFSLFFSSSATTHDLSLLTPFTLSTTKHQHCHRDTISPLFLFIGMYKSLSLSLYPRVSLIFLVAATITVITWDARRNWIFVELHPQLIWTTL
jgi:hypothetical protein